MKTVLTHSPKMPIELSNAKCYEGPTVKNRIRHIAASLFLVAGLSACQNHNGIGGSNNWGRSGYANNFLNTAINPNYIDPNGGQVVAYIVNGGGVAQTTFPTSGSTAGGLRPLNNTQGGTAGGIAGGVSNGSSVLGSPCTLKIASVSNAAYTQGSNQNFGSTYNETNFASSGRGIYQIGRGYPITCGPDSEVAGTATAFYATSGSAGSQIWVFRVDRYGALIGSNAINTVSGPTKITASASGHIAVVTDGGRTLRLFMENRVGGDGSLIAGDVASLPSLGNQIIKDVVIDQKQGALYVASAYPNNSGLSVKVYALQAAYQGIFQPYYNTEGSVPSSFSSSLFPSYSNIAYNQDESVAASIFKTQGAPLKIKNYDGLTGVLLTSGKPFFIETELSEPASEISSQQIANQQNATEGIVTGLDVFDPFSIVPHQGISNLQVPSTYVDLAVGLNFMYGITPNSILVSCYISKDDPWDCATPRTQNLSFLGRLISIEMSNDQQYAIVAGSNGLSIGNKYGNYLSFSLTGQPDIVEAGGVLHAAALAKFVTVPTTLATTNNTTNNTTTRPTNTNTTTTGQ